ncbi:hypothetical protein AHAS_Ahas20G0201100 [Arachis hypogaea]|uniref:Cellulose synthase RING-type zinc finger domain-containing protein n=1 Tax=Arachis hypogaea TaxID=3818 RepID=A0A444X3Y6_ARAHY|nr:hypothetical protein Ahy_B10g103788 [Arachis hypogaea]
MPKSLKNLNGKICQICGETIGLTDSGDVFVACNECAFPVCHPYYEYERKDGNQCCPSVRLDTKGTKNHLWISGSPKVDGDKDEDDVADLENKFSYGQGKAKPRPQWDEDADISSSLRHEQPIPLFTYRHQLTSHTTSFAISLIEHVFVQISSETTTPDTQSTRTTSGPLGPSDKVHSLPYVDPRQPIPVRIVDPLKDLNSYGLGNVDWKERVESWKLKQEKNVVHVSGSRYNEGKGDIEGTGSNGEELQM